MPRTACGARNGASVSTSSRSSGTRSAASRSAAAFGYVEFPANENHQSGCARHSSIRSGIEKQWRITRDAARELSEHPQRVVLGGARVDHERLRRFARERDLCGERALLIGRGRAVAVVVEPGLADRDAPRVRGQRLQLGEVGVVEPGRAVRVAADRGVHLREVLGGLERRAARRAVGPDRDDPR